MAPIAEDSEEDFSNNLLVRPSEPIKSSSVERGSAFDQVPENEPGAQVDKEVSELNSAAHQVAELRTAHSEVMATVNEANASAAEATASVLTAEMLATSSSRSRLLFRVKRTTGGRTKLLGL